MKSTSEIKIKGALHSHGEEEKKTEMKSEKKEDYLLVGDKQ